MVSTFTAVPETLIITNPLNHSRITSAPPPGRKVRETPALTHAASRVKFVLSAGVIRQCHYLGEQLSLVASRLARFLRASVIKYNLKAARGVKHVNRQRWAPHFSFSFLLPHPSSESHSLELYLSFLLSRLSLSLWKKERKGTRRVSN